jgi:hypothetical protein
MAKRLFFSCIAALALTGTGTALWGQSAGFAYVANCGAGAYCSGGVGSGTVSAYTIDGITGALTPVVGSPFPAGSVPRSVTTTAGPPPPPAAPAKK